MWVSKPHINHMENNMAKHLYVYYTPGKLHETPSWTTEAQRIPTQGMNPALTRWTGGESFLGDGGNA